jgi:hypothetical protein
MPLEVDHLVLDRELVDQFLVFLLALALRADRNEIEQREDADHEGEGDHRVAAGGWRGGLGVGGWNEKHKNSWNQLNTNET